MSGSVLVTASVDSDVEARAAEILESRGLTVSEALEIMLTRTAVEGDLPFRLEGAGEEHDAWFRAMVRQALEDRSGDLPDEEAERRMTERRTAAATRQ